jgi:hypothetical protein
MSLPSQPNIGKYYCSQRREHRTHPFVANVPFRLWLQVRVWVVCDNDAQAWTVAPFRLQSLVSVIEVSRVCCEAQVTSFADIHE